MGTRSRLLLCLIPVLCLALCGCSLVLDPVESAPPTGTPETSPISLPSPPEPVRGPAYPDVPVYFDGLLSDKGYLVEGTLYLSPAAICGFFGEPLETTVTDDGVLMTGDGLELYGITGLEYLHANGRYLYTPLGWFEADGRVYFPADAVEKLLGIQVRAAEDGSQVEIAGGGIAFLEGGEDYYARHFPTEDLFWLSRIINSESMYEPLAGKIGVGNVVLNRVASDDFPDTIYEVIYDRKYNVQFDPIVNGSVLGEPEEQSVIAACLCLEGANTVGDSLYFVNPERGISSWFERDLTPTVVIGHHHFYVE